MNGKEKMTFIRENRYLIAKGTDMCGLSSVEIEWLEYLSKRLAQLREFRGAKPLQCVVVESDWPEYETVWKMIEDRVNNES